MAGVTPLKYLHLYLPVFVLVWVGLYLDSAEFAQRVPYNQWLANIAVMPVFFWLYFHSPRYLKEMMLFGLFVAILGETLFSLILGMYTYRLENIPLYIFFGHSIIYGGVYYLAKEPFLRQKSRALIKILFVSAMSYAFLWLLFADDLFGFLCTVALALLLRKYKRPRLFFLLMYFTVAYLELVGTHYGCWSWPDVWFDVVTFIPSANPPSGIGFFYFLFDAGCLWFYKKANKRRWQRLRAVQKSVYQP